MNNMIGRREIQIVLAWTALGLALRCLGIGHESLWYDEAYSLKTAAAPIWKQLNTEATDPGNPSLYFILLKFWQIAFGNSIEAARYFSAFAGCLSVPAVWFLCRQLQLPTPCGVLAMAFTALSPPLIYLGQEARCFALFATVATMTLAYAVRIAQGAPSGESEGAAHRPSWSLDGLKQELRDMFQGSQSGDWIPFLLLCVALLHIHYYAFFVLAALGLYLLLTAWSSGRPNYLQLVISSAILVILFLPWLPVFLWQLKQGAQRSVDSWWQHAVMMPMFAAIGRTLTWRHHGQLFVAMVALLVMACYVVPLKTLWKERSLLKPDLFFVVALMTIVVCVSLFLTPMIHSHYLSVVFPAFYVVLARGFYSAWRSEVPLHRLSANTLAFLVFCSMIGLYFGQHKHDWRGLAVEMHRRNPDAPVFCYEDLAELPYSYYQQRLVEGTSQLPPITRIIEPFGAAGANWRTEDVLYAMDRSKGGFWFILYETYPATKQETPWIIDFMKKRYRVEETIERPSMMALLLKPWR